MGDATSFYWATDRLTRIQSSADYVTAGEYGWYQSDYRWVEGKLREMIREGEQNDVERGMLPYRVHIRFSKDGDAVYQQYRLDGRVLPLQREQLQRYQAEANSVAEKTKQQSKSGLSLIQGYWDGESFETCEGKDYQGLEFNQTLPSFVVNRLSAVDSYVAFLGTSRLGKLQVKELLLLADDDHDCVERPQLLEDD